MDRDPAGPLTDETAAALLWRAAAQVAAAARDPAGGEGQATGMATILDLACHAPPAERRRARAMRSSAWVPGALVTIADSIGCGDAPMPAPPAGSAAIFARLPTPTA